MFDIFEKALGHGNVFYMRILSASAIHGGAIRCPVIRHTSGISGGFRQLRIYDSAVMANFGTFVMRRE